MGVLKALVGLMGRPMVGALEGTSKLFHSLALASLGREGILGKMQRRVKAPGAFAEVGAEQAEEEPRREAEAQMRQLMAAWQRVLPEFFPGMAGDTVSGERGGPGACAAQTEETAACRAWRARVLLCCCCSHGCPPALTLPIRPLTHPTTTYPHPPTPTPAKTHRRHQRARLPRGAHHRPPHRLPAGAAPVAPVHLQGQVAGAHLGDTKPVG